jgi:acylglycerol lipase
MGHSMGGGIAIALASLPEYQALVKDIRGLILESPYIALPTPIQPSRLTAAVGRVASKFLPHYQLFGRVPVTYYSRDPAVMRNKEEDELCHATGTLEILSSMMDRAANIDSGAYKLSKDVTSLVLYHGTGDQVTSFDASKRWIERQEDIPDITFKPFEGWSHGLHCDLPDNRSVFAKEVGDWILARSNVKE